MRFAYSRRTFLTAVLFVTVIGKVLAEDRVLELAIHDAESPAKPPVLSVLQNDRVVVRLTSDKPLHVHLHGYDIESDVAPNLVTSKSRSGKTGALIRARIFGTSSQPFEAAAR